MAILNIPARTAENTVAEHVDDHNKLREVFNDLQASSLVFIPADAMALAEGTPAKALMTGGYANTWALDAASTESVIALFRPNHWNGTAEDAGSPTLAIDLWYHTPLNGVSATVLEIQVAAIRSGLAPAFVTLATPVLAPSSTTASAKSTVATSTFDPTGIYAIRIRRLGAHASDTYAGDFGILGVDLRRA